MAPNGAQANVQFARVILGADLCRARSFFRQQAEPVAAERCCCQQELHDDEALADGPFAAEQRRLAQGNAIADQPFALRNRDGVPRRHVDPGERWARRRWLTAGAVQGQVDICLGVEIHARLAALAIVRPISSMGSPLRLAASASAASALAPVCWSSSRSASMS